MKADKWFFVAVLAILGVGDLILQSRISKLEQAAAVAKEEATGGKVREALDKFASSNFTSRGLLQVQLFDIYRTRMNRLGCGIESMEVYPDRFTLIFTNGPQSWIRSYAVAP